MNLVHIFILIRIIENKKNADPSRRSISIMVTQEGFEPPTL